jgi:hypothetical protein
MGIKSLVLAIVLASAGCVNVDYVATNTPPHAMRPRPASQVEVFQTGIPSRPYVEVGYLEVQAQTNDPEFLIDQLREEAGERGCEGIVFIANNDSTSTHATITGTGAAVRTTKNKGYRAVCIAYRDPA